MIKDTTKHFAKRVGDSAVQEKLRRSQNSADLIKTASEAAGTEMDADDVSSTMRNIARAELEKHGFPQWAINSMFLGEPVCW